jgi:glutamate synthase domain-containing protein 3
MIVGNTVLYGATDGLLCAAGQAGDRFAVRNSGACAVVEGVGNHACEYMTGGVVAVLGRAGRNFGAGMSNGIAYVLDEAGTFPSRLNHELVLLADLDQDDDILLERLLRVQLVRTGSARARSILDNWSRVYGQWRKVKPRGAGEPVAVIRQTWSTRLLDLLEADGGATAMASVQRG